MIKYNHNLGYGLTLVNDRVVRKTAKLSTRQAFEHLQAICTHLMRHPDPTIVPIYDFKVLCEPQSVFGWYEYQYDMMRLGMLSNDEKDFILRLTLLNRSEWNDHAGIQEYKKSFPELYSFIDTIAYQGRYCDIHAGNFLKNEQEQFFTIDLEGFYSGQSLDHPDNNWIIR